MTRRTITTIIAITVLAAILAAPLASAADPTPTPEPTQTLPETPWYSVLKNTFINATVCPTPLAIFFAGRCLGAVVVGVNGLVGYALDYTTKALTGVLSFSQSVVAPNIITDIWKIFRNFINMFFILVLIIMAFGTIFDVPKYTFKDMFPRFLTSALLINFSVEIGKYILRIANGLSAVFLTTIGDVGERMHQGFSLGTLIAPDLPGGTGGLIAALASLIFLTIVLGTFIAALVFIVVRIVVIWFLLILSPVAWFGYMLPSLKAETWSKWWKTFISWAFFLPTYLFFIMFAAMLLRARNTIAPNPVKFFEFIGVNDFVFYTLTLIVLIGGISASFKVGGFAANGAGAVMGGAQNYMKGARIFGGRSISDFQGGLKQLGGRVHEKGLPTRIGKMIYGGSEAAKVREQRISQGLGGMLGYRSLQEGNKAEQAAATQVADELLNDPKIKIEDLEKELATSGGADLTNIVGQINTEQVGKYLALAKKGKLTSQMLKDLTAKIGDKNPEIMKDIGKSLAETSFGGFKDADVAAVLATDDKSNKAVRKEAQRWMSSEDGKRRMPDILAGDPKLSDDDRRKWTEGIVRQGMDDLGKTTGEARGFLRAVGEKRAELAGAWKAENEEIKDDEGRIITDAKEKRVHATKKVIEDKTEREILSMSKETWADTDFKQALSQKMDDLLSRSPVGEYEGQFDPGEMAKFIQGMRSASRSVGDFQKKMENFDLLLNEPRTMKVKIRTETGKPLEESVENAREALNKIAAERRQWEENRYARQRSAYERRGGGGRQP